uniref:Kinesin motor domain-containing protein n=1 Tax=Romanomermis culicivorax TaxID=13658 RepID=A0A915KZD1_ROMCU
MLEIYNDSIRDLLSGRAKLDIKLSTDSKIHVPGLTKMGVTRLDQINEILKIGRQNRVTASTKLNDVSSRSHAILIVHLKGENEISQSSINSYLNLVDLAGSERLEKSGVSSSDRLKETQCINKSLSALGDVICALRNRRQHIQNMFSSAGDSKTIMVVQLAPNSSSICETLCSLNFASRVKGVELGQASIHKTTNHFFNTNNASDNSDDSLSSRKENTHKFYCCQCNCRMCIVPCDNDYRKLFYLCP